MITPYAEKTIKNHVLMSLGVAALPLPGLDIFLIYYIQLDMIKKLAAIYGKNYFEISGKAYLSTFTTVTLARLSSSFIKAIPGIGTYIGGASSIVLSGASTYALGKVTAKFFQENIELSDIDMDVAKSFFEEELEAGKIFAENLFKNHKKEMKEQRDLFTEDYKAKKEKEIYRKLVELKKMREDNLITEEEYDEKRKLLLGEI